MIEKGAQFIVKNLVQISNLEEIKRILTPGFELILPTLVDESKKFGLEFGSDNIIDLYREEKRKKLKKIKLFESDRDMKGSCPWYFNLEGFNYTKEKIVGMFDSNGLICGCYSATAFALCQGIDSPKSLAQIRKVVDENKGGVPNIYSLVVFDLAWSLNFLHFSGYPIRSEILDTHIEKLASIWEENKGLVGGTITGLPPDADDTSNVLLILKLTDRFIDEESKNGLMRFFNGKYFTTYEAEMQPSLTTNINCLIAMIHFKNENSNYVFEKEIEIVSKWIKFEINKNDYRFDDKWHLSKFYGMSRALIAFLYCDFNFSEVILNRIIESQNYDGGWGIEDSTVLESSYIIIAVSHWLRFSKVDKTHNGWIIMKATSEYMRTIALDIDDTYKFWIDKGMYSLVNLDKLTIYCALHALDTLK